MTRQLRALGMFSGGQRLEAENGRTRDVVDPATGKTRATIPRANADHADQSGQAARQAVDRDWFAEDEEAIRWADGTDCGLSASVRAKDINRAMKAAKALESGTVWINDHGSLVSETLQGGFKESGMAKAHLSIRPPPIQNHLMVKLS